MTLIFVFMQLLAITLAYFITKIIVCTMSNWKWIVRSFITVTQVQWKTLEKSCIPIQFNFNLDSHKHQFYLNVTTFQSQSKSSLFIFNKM